MTILLSDLVEVLRDQAGDQPSRDTLNGTITSGATSLTLTDGQYVNAQQFISIENEVLFVQTKPSTTTATVVRAVKGSTAAAHTTGVEVLAGFRHASFIYQRSINRSLDAISQVFGKPTWDSSQSFGNGITLIAVPATAIRPPFAVMEQPTSDLAISRVPWTYMNSVPTSLVSTGKAIQLTGYNPGTGLCYIGYEVVWPNLSLLTDALDSAYPVDGIDLIEIGARAYIMDSEVFERIAFTQPHARVQTNVAQIGEVRTGARDAAVEFVTRRAELAARYGHRQHAWIKGTR